MARLILLIVLASIFYYVLHFLLKDASSFRKKVGRGVEPEELVQDPYCQTYIPERSALKKKVAGKVLYFCSQTCMEGYLKKRKKG
jgi:YHS domain-containing protein